LDNLLPEKPLASACEAREDIISRVAISRFACGGGNCGIKVSEKAIVGYEALRSVS
jgi:hypothetical protein